jgi:hypothetical protein
MLQTAADTVTAKHVQAKGCQANGKQNSGATYAGDPWPPVGRTQSLQTPSTHPRDASPEPQLRAPPSLHYTKRCAGLSVCAEILVRPPSPILSVASPFSYISPPTQEMLPSWFLFILFNDAWMGGKSKVISENCDTGVYKRRWGKHPQSRHRHYAVMSVACVGPTTTMNVVTHRQTLFCRKSNPSRPARGWSLYINNEGYY